MKELAIKTAIEFLAKKHNVTEAEVMMGYLTDQPAVVKQVHELLATVLTEADLV